MLQWSSQPSQPCSGGCTAHRETPPPAQGQHKPGDQNTSGAAVSGWRLLGLAFPSDPLPSAMLVTPAHEDLATKGRVGNTLFFFFSQWNIKGTNKGRRLHQCFWQVKFHSQHRPHNPAMPVPCWNCPSTEPAHSCDTHSHRFPAYSLEEPLMAQMTPHLF